VRQIEHNEQAKTMKYTISLKALTAGLLVAWGSMALGDTVIVDRIDQMYPGGNIYGGVSGFTDSTDGGEFTDIPSNTSILSHYVAATTVTDPNVAGPGNVGFQSFCLETNFTYPGSPPTLPTAPLNDLISNSIINSGGTVTLGTAWLYSQFAAGTLTGYNYTNTAASFGATGWASPRGTDAAALQAAIWYLQGQITFTQAGGSTNQYLNLLTASTGSGGLGLGTLSAALASDPNNIYNVEVLNVGDAAANYQYQAQLVIAPSSVPDGGTTVMLMGIALGGLALLRRKFAV
jgi:hypothetical protein